MPHGSPRLGVALSWAVDGELADICAEEHCQSKNMVIDAHIDRGFRKALRAGGDKRASETHEDKLSLSSFPYALSQAVKIFSLRIQESLSNSVVQYFIQVILGSRMPGVRSRDEYVIQQQIGKH